MMRIKCKNIEANLIKFNDFRFRIKPHVDVGRKMILCRVGGAFGVTDQATRLFTLLYCRLHPSVLQSFYYSSIQTHIQHEISSC
jgi:hypothetical protein